MSQVPTSSWLAVRRGPTRRALEEASLVLTAMAIDNRVERAEFDWCLVVPEEQAAQAVRDELGALQEELQAAREEIKFYRGIVSPGEGNQGLRIHNFTLTPGLQAGEYQYDLVLTQLQRNDRYVSGKVVWNITGKQDDSVSELGLAAVTKSGAKSLEFRFRYFQHLTGVITLPDGFSAHKVELTVRATGKKAPEPVAEVFDWPDSADWNKGE